MRKIFIWLILSFPAFSAPAQNSWPSPEVEQMYYNAAEKSTVGNYKDAIITFRQAIILAPDKVPLYKGLAKALYQSGAYAEAEKAIKTVMGRKDVDDTCFDVLAAAQDAQNNSRGASHTIARGLEHFPESGLLYHDKGHILEQQKRPGAALQAWVDGIHHSPACAINYYEAASKYMASDDVMWGLLYAETYLDIAHDTIGDADFKKKFFGAWKAMFDDVAAGNAGAFTAISIKDTPASFIDAVRQTYNALTPVVSDGITTENLTMARTRFLMAWFDKYSSKYPFALFAYQDYLVKNGLFDIYNEWLFGKAESIAAYNAWIQFHPDELDIFLEKKKAHPLMPTTGDAYSTETSGRR